MRYLSLMKPNSGHIVTIATPPNSTQMQESGIMRRPGNPRIPFHVKMGLNVLDRMKRLRAQQWGVRYQNLMLDPSGDRLRTLGEYIEQRNLPTVVGRTIMMEDFEAVREMCQMVFDGKGGTGKMVIQMVEERIPL